ncbi:MAG TPA: 50S ribosomal protein L18Ae [Methanocorpusculum sp.]|nr:50S ribosomal protein L18Ae [Methanocorpusculum sp.]HJJ55987.1 50S ribosomal protein L18Ae [Methanocorpusculum sp.]
MPKFEVKGKFKNDGMMKSYTKIIDAPNENVAKEFTIATFGSKHRLGRKYITVDTVKSIDGQ